MWGQRLLWGLPLLGIALLTSWLVWDMNHVAEKQAKSTAAYPDYTLKEFFSMRMDEQGKLNSLLQASSMMHYPETDTELVRPYLVFYQNAQPLWYILAETGKVSPDQNHIWLYGKTYVWRAAPSAAHLPIELHTTNVHIIVPEQFAETAAPTRIFSGRDTISSIGMKSWLQTHFVELNSRVRGHYVPKP